MLMPMRKSEIRPNSSAMPALRSAMPRCKLDEQRHRIDYAWEFQQQTVTGRLDDAAVMFGDLGINKLPPMGFQRGQGPTVVHAHKARVTGHIERDDCSKTPMVACQTPSFHPAPCVLDRP